jgi:cyclic pyranopterin phosphate synthase
MKLTHRDDEGRIQMVGVGHKAATERVAVARGEVRMKRETLRLIARGPTPTEPDQSSQKGGAISSPEGDALSPSKGGALSLRKGDVLTTAQIAGIMAAKRTHDLIPLCHPLPLTKIDVDLEIDEDASRIVITATVRCTGPTGVEMEALTAVSVAALTVYDMAKAVEKTMRIGDIQLIRKSGGRSGDWRLEKGE